MHTRDHGPGFSIIIRQGTRKKAVKKISVYTSFQQLMVSKVGDLERNIYIGKWWGNKCNHFVRNSLSKKLWCKYCLWVPYNPDPGASANGLNDWTCIFKHAEVISVNHSLQLRNPGRTKTLLLVKRNKISHQSLSCNLMQVITSTRKKHKECLNQPHIKKEIHVEEL